MRILFAGATGVLGRATLPHLRGHDVVGLTRSPERTEPLRASGVDAAVCDVLDYDALERLAQQLQPHIVVNFVTDLASGSIAANNRVRREGGGNLLRAAEQVNAGRLVVESIAFAVDGDAAEAVEELETGTRSFPGEALILRFGRLWGPDTFYATPPDRPAVQADRAGAEAARLLVEALPGTYVVT